ncbi:hypothetical protein [Rhodoplanes sp. SY1]|uniref:hypothetical protein n=1 Tax=Rhodoplanes sp. SY1 TaxID=3166646 RepID=UPI0038B5531B
MDGVDEARLVDDDKANAADALRIVAHLTRDGLLDAVAGARINHREIIDLTLAAAGEAICNKELVATIRRAEARAAS